MDASIAAKPCCKAASGPNAEPSCITIDPIELPTELNADSPDCPALSSCLR